MSGILDPLIGLRVDGRRPNELRKMTCEIGTFPHADGSATISQGNTKVIATVYGPHEVGFGFKSLNFQSRKNNKSK